MPERAAVFAQNFLEDLQYWTETAPRTATRVLQLVRAVLRDPFTGIGKPEPLKRAGPNTWSRRITQEHRLMYVVEHDRITFTQARFHYQR